MSWSDTIAREEKQASSKRSDIKLPITLEITGHQIQLGGSNINIHTPKHRCKRSNNIWGLVREEIRTAENYEVKLVWKSHGLKILGVWFILNGLIPEQPREGLGISYTGSHITLHT